MYIYLFISSVNGNWGAWGSWSPVNSSGYVTRSRECNNPAPLHGGQKCHGSATDTQPRPGRIYKILRINVANSIISF